MTTLVLGAGGTIGRACVDQLKASRKTVIAADLVMPVAAGVECRVVDVTNLESVHNLVQEIEAHDRITGLVYAAGVNFTGNVDQTDWAQYQKLMQVNLQGAFHFGAELQRVMRENPRKFSAVFIASTAALKGESGGSIYVATKFGLRGFVESFAAEIASLGGRANTVCPGNVDSPMLTKLAEGVAERTSKSVNQVLQDFANASSFNRLITSSEVASTVTWLLSDFASGISGQTIVVDGAPV